MQLEIHADAIVVEGMARGVCGACGGVFGVGDRFFEVLVRHANGEKAIEHRCKWCFNFATIYRQGLPKRKVRDGIEYLDKVISLHDRFTTSARRAGQ